MLKMRMQKSKDQIILAMCDLELIGRKLKEGEITLDLERYASFYDSEDINEEDKRLEEKTKEATVINAVGERSISTLGRFGFDIKNVRKIQNIPHIQIFKI